LFAASGSDALHVWETATGSERLHLSAEGRLTGWTPAEFARCLAFAPDGGTLATGHADGSVLLWDLAPAWKRLGPAPGPLRAEADWQALAGDARAAYGAIGRLAAPDQSVSLLRDRLRPVPLDQRWLTERLAGLDSDSFAERE